MPKCYQLVGVPGSGKSTWVKNQTWMLGMFVVSTDVFVEDYAKKQGKTYSEVFDEYMPTAVDLMVKQVVFCRENNLDLVWDQTSTTVKSRLKKFNMLPDYEHIAIVFPTPPTAELQERLSNRPGKNVPWHIVSQMANQLEIEPPTEEEGFKEIWRT